MYNVDLFSDRVAAASLAKRRDTELQRQDRIFNAKVRTIGIDKAALDSQINERKARTEAEEQILKEWATDLVCNDRTACLLDQRQAKDERQLQKDIYGFRQAFQQPWSRREFDLNDPEFLRTQKGIQMLPGLVGEDPGRQDRLMRQKEQLREWSIQQQNELATALSLRRQEEQQYDQDRVDLDNKALQLQKIEEERRKAVTLAIKDFNQAMAAEQSERRLRERRQQEEDNRTDILNQLQGELLSESPEQGVSVLGLSRIRPDSYKSITPEQQRNIIHSQLQQVEQKKRIQAEEQQEKVQQDGLRVASARAGLLLERQQARLVKQLRRELDNSNAKLAEAHHAQKTFLEKKVYSNTPDESYFSQFNTGSR